MLIKCLLNAYSLNEYGFIHGQLNKCTCSTQSTLTKICVSGPGPGGVLIKCLLNACGPFGKALAQPGLFQILLLSGRVFRIS